MIRRAVAGDLERLEQLWLYTVVTSHPSLPRTYWRGRLDEFRRSYLGAENCLVFYESRRGTADGFVVVGRGQVLEFLCITPAVAGRGGGSELMRAAKVGRAQLEATLLQENLGGRYFLQQHGFVEAERKPSATAAQAEIVMRYSAGREAAA
ncbi:hypothetical protein [Microbulbifer litoralis]|uniref:hypothetical protein n=1 Tax=Microbulbifer litoralis TaxID=2933965 RepID=UPI0020297898|nr:hypothetical protein [Microbulbifer sp. GX H0434]